MFNCDYNCDCACCYQPPPVKYGPMTKEEHERAEMFRKIYEPVIKSQLISSEEFAKFLK